jgi:spore coat protein H
MNHSSTTRWACAGFLFLCLFPPPGRSQQPTRTTPLKPDASDAFFQSGVVPSLKIEINKEELAKLRQKDREYVSCTVIENGKTRYENVGIHLKGAAGSYRPIDDRPALTLNFDKLQPWQRFHALDKIHLNNSVQDPSYLEELLCSRVFLENKIPTPRSSHARVWLNGRDLGFYVLKEGFNHTFLKRYFDDPTGNLYDGGFLQDIDAALKKQMGDGPTDQSDLKKLAAACREPDLTKRWQKISELIDVDYFITFMAIELMTCHWDGYCMQRNNYRVYFDPKSKKAYFFPHGMDQMFREPGYGILQVPGTIVANAIMTNPEWRMKYRDKVSQLLPRFNPPTQFHKQVDEAVERIKPILQAINPNSAADFQNQANGLKERLSARAKNLVEQNAVVEPRPLKFDASGVAVINKWEKQSESADAKLDVRAGESKALCIACGPSGNCIASWRSKVILPAGKYRFEATAQGDKIKGNKDSQGHGAGIRLSGNNRSNHLEGTSGWQPLVHEFTISQPQQEVELVAELRAQAGKVSFQEGSLKVVRVGK